MKKIISVLTIVALFYACNKKKEPVPNNEPGPSTINGKITGNIIQYNQYGLVNTSGLNTVTVSIDGTNYSTVSDASGNYTLTNVAPGTYNISFNRTGCGLWQKQQVSFAGNGTYYLNGYSTEKPTYSFTGLIKDSVSVGPIPTHRIFAYLQMNPLPTNGGILVLRGQNPNIDINNPMSYQNIYQSSISANASSIKLMIDYGYSGTWYYRAYPYANIYAGAFYDDVPTEKRVYTAYGSELPGVFAITIP